MNKTHEIDIGGVPEQNVQESLEGLKNPEVRDHNNEVQQPAPNGAEEINSSVEGVASGTSLATVATRRERKNLVSQKNKQRTHLTPTGLLMEGD